jgi:hypothetical protein
MTFRLLQRFGFLLSAFCVACSGTSALQSAPQNESGFAAAPVPLVAMASSQITGTATSCSSFYACVYTITNSQGHGSATTYFYYNYQYQYNTYAKFQLPGEVKTTTSQPYKTNILGQSGNTYHVGGSLTAIDANTGKVVTGTTDDYIVRTQHCYRTGCYYTYALSSGTIAFTLTALDGTATSVACNPATFPAGGSTTCTVTVTDLANSGNFPAGSVAFGISTYGEYGTFTPPSCALSSGSCSVSFRPSDNSVGTIGITASYPGDSSHYMSSGSTTVSVTGD